MIKKMFDMFLSDAFVIACMSFMLFVLVCLFASPEHVIGMSEDNLVILTAEIAICIFAITWSARRVVRNLRRERAR